MSNKDKGKSHTAGDEETSAEKRTEKFGSRTVGTGMDSPDSTEAVLDSSTGDPDPRARTKSDPNSKSGRK